MEYNRNDIEINDIEVAIRDSLEFEQPEVVADLGFVADLLSEIEETPQNTKELLESFISNNKYKETPARYFEAIKTSIFQSIQQQEVGLFNDLLDQIKVSYLSDDYSVNDIEKYLESAFFQTYCSIYSEQDLIKSADLLAKLGNEKELEEFILDKKLIKSFYNSFTTTLGGEELAEVRTLIEVITNDSTKLQEEQKEDDLLTIEACVDIIFRNKKPNNNFDKDPITATLKSLIEGKEDLAIALGTFLNKNCHYLVEGAGDYYFNGLPEDNYKAILQCIQIERSEREESEKPAIKYKNNVYQVSGAQRNCLIISSLFSALKTDKFDLKDFVTKNKKVFDKDENKDLAKSLNKISKEVLMEYAMAENDSNNPFGKLVDVIRKDEDMLKIADQNPIDHIEVVKLEKILDVKIEIENTDDNGVSDKDDNKATFINRAKDDLLLMLSTQHDKDLVDSLGIEDDGLKDKLKRMLQEDSGESLDEEGAGVLLLEVAKVVGLDDITQKNLTDNDKNKLLDQVIEKLKGRRREDLPFYLKETVTIGYSESNEHFTIKQEEKIQELVIEFDDEETDVEIDIDNNKGISIRPHLLVYKPTKNLQFGVDMKQVGVLDPSSNQLKNPQLSFWQTICDFVTCNGRQ